MKANPANDGSTRRAYPSVTRYSPESLISVLKAKICDITDKMYEEIKNLSPMEVSTMFKMERGEEIGNILVKV